MGCSAVVDATFEIVRERMVAAAPTTGELLVEGEHFCYTLERPWNGNAVGTSCIPLGTYRVKLLPSERWGRPVPHVLNVPGRTAIELHAGNFYWNTEGCILLGESRSGATLVRSIAALDRFGEWFASVGNAAMLTIKLAGLPPTGIERL